MILPYICTKNQTKAELELFNLRMLTNVAENDVGKNAVYEKLVKDVNAIKAIKSRLNHKNLKY